MKCCVVYFVTISMQQVFCNLKVRKSLDLSGIINLVDICNRQACSSQIPQPSQNLSKSTKIITNSVLFATAKEQNRAHIVCEYQQTDLLVWPRLKLNPISKHPIISFVTISMF